MYRRENDRSGALNRRFQAGFAITFFGGFAGVRRATAADRGGGAGIGV
ncbi:MAG: hypothetical protein OXF33_00050 [Rhodospirillales bacterium]|nr:hypothetical protein [Rhodospirillales bacterium]MCY4002091.1 hypothetical protein [Rhodospirillales bacterium]